MKTWISAVVFMVLPGLAGAETLRSDTLEVDLTRRTVSMTSTEGKAIPGQQVYVTMRRRDGQPIGIEDLRDYVAYAERAACQGRTVLVSLMVGAVQGEGQYEVLCASGN